MTDNDTIVLNSIIEQKKNQTANELADDDYFELFSFEQVLKKYDLSYEELLSGKIGGGDDGGIDGFFIFVDNEIFHEDTEIEKIYFNRYIFNSI